MPTAKLPPQISILDNEENKNVLFEYKNYVKFIGLLIEGNFTWKDHIRTLTTKINKTVALIPKLRHIVPNRILLNIYKFLIVRYITHGLTSWGSASENLLNKVLVFQKRAFCPFHFAQAREHAILLFLKGKLLLHKST